MTYQKKENAKQHVKIMKKPIFLLLLIFCLSLSIFSVVQAEKHERLDLEYPAPPGGTALSPGAKLADYVTYVYYFSMGTAGVVAAVIIVIAGFRYTASVGDPGRIRDARSQISSALLGLVILFGAFLILNTINPQLGIFLEPDEPPSAPPQLRPGVAFCKESSPIEAFWDARDAYITSPPSSREEGIQRAKDMDNQLKEIRERCYWVGGSSDVREEFEDSISSVYLIPHLPGRPEQEKVRYGVIIYEESKFRGTAQILGMGEHTSTRPHKDTPEIKVSSARPFIFSENSSPSTWEVTTYERRHFNKELPPDEREGASAECDAGGFTGDRKCSSISARIGSVKLEGNLMLVFTLDPFAGEVGGFHPALEIDIFLDSDTDLYNNRMGEWKASTCSDPPLGGVGDPEPYPCADGLFLVNARIIP